MKPDLLTADRLRDVLHYDPATGIFTWVMPTAQCIKPGMVAGVLTKDGYIQICVDGRAYPAHRLAWLYVHGVWPAHQIDHVNGIRHENPMVNLREATASQNARNRLAHRGSKSGLKGVYPLPDGRFQSSIRHGGRNHYLGRFATAEEASAAYQAQARLHHQDFAPDRLLRPVPASAM